MTTTTRLSVNMVRTCPIRMIHAPPLGLRSLQSHQTDSMAKLQLLSSQQEVLRRRLSLQVPSPPPMPAQSPEFGPLSYSPTSSRSLSFSDDFQIVAPIPTEPHMGNRRSSDDPHGHVEDSHKLCEVNQQIKAMLTELLNTESVRSDEKYRAWVQERLLDAEHQIRLQRRRQSSADRDMAASIATNMTPISPRMSWR